MGVVADASAAVALNIASVAAQAPSTILIPFRSPSIATTDEPQLFLTVFRWTGLRH